MLRLLCAVVLGLISSVGTLPTGAPDFVCDMEHKRPNHPFDPQTIPLPYEIGASAFSVNSSTDNVTVTICSPPEEIGVLGFLVMAQNEKNETFGHWNQTDLARPLICGVTHNSRQPKPAVHLTWFPSKKLDTPTNVTFWAVLVKDFATFWIDIQVTKITEKSCKEHPIPPQLPQNHTRH